MGIAGLHAAVKPYKRNVHISKYRGQRVGVDASCWLHRGAIPHAAEILTAAQPWWAQQGHDPPYVQFAMRRINLMRQHGVVPVIVFDGGRLPAKAAEHVKRGAKREASWREAQALRDQERPEDADRVLGRCMDVTPGMAAELMARLREQRVEFVVAPYEADAQLAFLASIPPEEGGVTAVVTEDGDLVCYGVRAVLFKLSDSGHAEELLAEVMYAGPPAPPPPAAGVPPAAPPAAPEGPAASGGAGRGRGRGGRPAAAAGGRVVDFTAFSLEMVRAACVLAGCDFHPSLPGVQYITAHRIVQEAGGGGGVEGALRALREHRRFGPAVDDAYAAGARGAAAAFAHALVFDPRAGACRRLEPLPPALAALPPDHERRRHMGADVADDVARGIACGWLNANTLEPFDASRPPPPPSMWAAPAAAGAAGAAARRAQCGLGPLPPGAARQPPPQPQPLHPQQHAFQPPQPPPQPQAAAQPAPVEPPPGQQQRQRQQQRRTAPVVQAAQAGGSVCDLIEMYRAAAPLARPPAGPPPPPQERQRQPPRAPAANPFARQQLQQPAARPPPQPQPPPQTPQQQGQAAGLVGPLMHMSGVTVTASTAAALWTRAVAGPGPIPRPRPRAPSGAASNDPEPAPPPDGGGSDGGGGAQARSWVSLATPSDVAVPSAAAAAAAPQPSSMVTHEDGAGGNGGGEAEVTSPLRPQQPGVWAPRAAPAAPCPPPARPVSAGGMSSWAGMSGGSSGSGSSGKRKSAGTKAPAPRPGKRQANLTAAAAGSLRISNFFLKAPAAAGGPRA